MKPKSIIVNTWKIVLIFIILLAVIVRLIFVLLSDIQTGDSKAWNSVKNGTSEILLIRINANGNTKIIDDVDTRLFLKDFICKANQFTYNTDCSNPIDVQLTITTNRGNIQLFAKIANSKLIYVSFLENHSASDVVIYGFPEPPLLTAAIVDLLPKE